MGGKYIWKIKVTGRERMVSSLPMAFVFLFRDGPASGRTQWHFNGVSWEMDGVKHHETFESHIWETKRNVYETYHR